MKHCTLNTLILSLALCRAAALSKRTYKATKAEGTAGPLVINLHQMPTPATTQIAHYSAAGEEWLSITPGDMLLEMHNGTREPWTPPSFTGYPSTGFSANKWKGIAYSTNAGTPDEEWENKPPASILNVGYTSYSINGGYDKKNNPMNALAVEPPFLQDVKLKDNFFFVQTPSYLRFLLPACPNYTPETADLTSECPVRVCKPGEWKFSLIGLLSGTNINSLKSQRPLPTSSNKYEKKSERDISKYKTLIYSTILDVGAMGEGAEFEAEFPDGSKKKFSEIPATRNINDAKLHIKGPKSTHAVTLTFVKYYGVGTFTRKVSDFVCTKQESYSQGSTFGKCTRDVTGMKEGDDGKPTYSPFEAAEKGTVGDPVLKTEKVKEMKVTIRPASCEGRPSTPSDPWPEKNSDCPWWYTATGHTGKWAVDDEKDPQEPEGQTKDQQTYCESGYCFHIDFHVDLGGTTLSERTIFGNPDNAITNGIEKGTFFVYDPTIDGGPLPIFSPSGLGIALICIGVVLVACCCGAGMFFLYKKRKGVDAEIAPRTKQ